MAFNFIKINILFCLVTLAQCKSVRDYTKVTFIHSGYKSQAYSPSHLANVLSHPSFDRSKPTVIYSYGLTETPFQPSVRNIVDAYLESGHHNFMVISCDSILHYTIFNAEEIAHMVAEGLMRIFNLGYGQFHLVGFSLGGQIAGLIGRKIMRLSNQQFRIPRITGIDPGQLPPFINFSLEFLSPSDADFVDVIHVETKYLGSAQSNGHATFWPNGGVTQPMCKTKIMLISQICSHLMGPKYWADSVRSNDTRIFPALRCRSYGDFKSKNCDPSVVNHMGLHTDVALRGNFYLDTNHFPPYSREF